jgi:hypothetical protein
MTEPQQILKLHQPNWYEVDVDKLSKATMKDVAHLLASLRVSETYDYFEAVKPFLKIPEKSKTLEEIQQELDEKFEKLLVQTRSKFAVSKNIAAIRFEKFCKKQDADFEYAKEYGQFPQYLYLSTTGNVSLGNGIVPNSYLTVSNSGLQWGTEFRFGNANAGYYFVEPDVKFFRPKKPNFIVRFFMDKCLGFKWRDV